MKESKRYSRMLVKEPQAVLPGREYQEDQPWSCRYCYWWGNSKGCLLEECNYLIKEKKEKKQKSLPKIGNCQKCQYGKHAPCIGFCIAKLEYEIRMRYKQKKE